MRRRYQVALAAIAIGLVVLLVDVIATVNQLENGRSAGESLDLTDWGTGFVAGGLVLLGILAVGDAIADRRGR